MFNDKNKIISDYEFLLRYLIDGGVVIFRDYPVAYFSNSGVSSGNFNSESWKCEISEHLTLYKSLKLEQKYLFGYLNQVFKYEERENTKYLIILLMKNVFIFIVFIYAHNWITNHINIIYKIINDALKDIIIKITIIRTYEANVITSC